MKHLIDPLDFTVEETLELLELADQIALDSSPYAKACRGKILATLFYEPSTRTRRPPVSVRNISSGSL